MHWGYSDHLDIVVALFVDYDGAENTGFMG